VTALGATASFTLSCPASPPGAVRANCIGQLTLTAHEQGVGRSLVLVESGSGTTNVVVGTSSYVVPPDSTGTITVRLNPLGRRLLARFYKFPATAAATGASGASRTVNFAYSRIHSTLAWTFAFGIRFTTVRELRIDGIPSGASVLILCRGGGCPFARRVLPAPKPHLSVTDQFKGARLRPHTIVWFAVTAPNSVGKVEGFTIRSGQAPGLTFDCLPPGAAAPLRCVS
jgi:hypothetical protein